MKHLALLAAITAGFLSAGAATAQTYPERPVNLVVPFPPGGAVDTVARILSAALQPELGQPVVVENRPGAGGNVAAAYVANAAADGYTALLTVNGIAISPALYQELPYDPAALTPLVRVIESPLLIVTGATSGIDSLDAFVERAEAEPGRLNYGSTGVGNPLHLTMERLKLATGTDVRMVPYSGDAELAQALAQGQVDIAVVPIATAIGMVEGGAIRALAATGDSEVDGLPDVPSLADLGYPGFSGSWQGVFVPTGTPDAAKERLREAIDLALADEEVIERLANLRGSPIGSDEDFDALMAEQMADFARIIEDAGIPRQ